MKDDLSAFADILKVILPFYLYTVKKRPDSALAWTTVFIDLYMFVYQEL